MVLEQITKNLPHTKCSVYVSSVDDCKYIVMVSSGNFFDEDICWRIKRILDEINKSLTNITIVYLVD